LCASQYAGLEYCFQQIAAPGSHGLCTDVLHCVSAYRGLARCSVSLCPELLAHIDRSLVPLLNIVEATIERATAMDNSLDGSRVLSEWLGFLADFAEATPISSLPQASLSAVMSVAQRSLLVTVCNQLRLLAPTYAASVASRAGQGRSEGPRGPAIDESDASSVFIEILSGALVYLDHIASSDVAVNLRGVNWDQNDKNAFGSNIRALGLSQRTSYDANIEVDALLCTSLLMLSSEVITPEIMSSFKTVRDRYLSITNLILRSHPIALGSTWLSLGTGLVAPEQARLKLDMFQQLLAHVLSNVESTDSSAGRLALLTLKSFGAFYKKISFPTAISTVAGRQSADLAGLVIQEAADAFLLRSLAFMLGMMLPAAKSSNLASTFTAGIDFKSVYFIALH
jgi:hypothetical protein